MTIALRALRTVRHTLGLAAVLAISAPAHAATPPPKPTVAAAVPLSATQNWALADLYATPMAWDTAYADARAQAD